MSDQYVKLKQKRKLFEGDHAIQNKKFAEGLGEIPKDITNVESLLVFNSKINLFTHYKTFDNMSVN